MTSFFAQGRLGTELYNQPLYGLWMLVEHTPAGDPLMRGETFEVIKKRIVELSGLTMEQVDRTAKQMRDAKLASDLELYGNVDPAKRRPESYYTGTSSLGIPETEAYRESGYKQFG